MEQKQQRGRGREAPPPLDPDDAAAAERVALQILDAADQSSSDLIRRLRHRGCSADIAVQVVATMRERGYVNDDALAQSLVARRQRQGYGHRRVTSDLGARGLSAPPMAAAAMEAEAEAERDRAVEMARRLWRVGRADADPERERGRLARALQRRGFSSSDIVHALRALGAGADR